MIVKKKFGPKPAAYAWKPGTMKVMDLMEIACNFDLVITVSRDGYQIDYEGSICSIKSGEYLIIDGGTFDVMDESTFFNTYEIVG